MLSRTSVTTAVALVGLLTAIWGTVVGATEIPVHGVIAEPAGHVLDVLPGGVAWSHGVREGQAVVELSPGQSAADWLLVTTDGLVDYAVRGSASIANLRERALFGGLGVVLAAGALLFLRRRPWSSSAAGTIAVGLGVLPLRAYGEPVMSAVGAVLGLLMPAIWLATSGRLSTRRASLAILSATSLALAGLWLWSRFLNPSTFELAESGRSAAAVIGMAAVALLGWDWIRMLRLIRAFQPQRVVDLTSLVVGAGGIASLLAAGISPIAVVAVAALGLIVYPRWRNLLAQGLDRLLLAGIRERASITATEAERARLARDLHDAPLQELAGVIGLLERRDDTVEEADRLRGIAQQLRELTSHLRPPVLDDLGLGPALQSLVDQTNRSQGPRVELQLDDRTTFDPATRPPREVELNAYRVAQEAVANAAQHADASRIHVRAEVAREGIALAVQDDGIGISERRVRQAQLEGRLGVSSMERRAEVIGADLDIRVSEPSGTIVALTWRPTR